MFTIFTRVLPWGLNSPGNNFQVTMRLRFILIGLTPNVCNSRLVFFVTTLRMKNLWLRLFVLSLSSKS